MTLRRRRRVTSRGFRPERRRENRTPPPRKSDRSLSLSTTRAEKPHPVAKSRVTRAIVRKPSRTSNHPRRKHTPRTIDSLLHATKHPNAHSNPRACTFRPDFRLSKRKYAQFSRRGRGDSRAKLKKSKSARRRRRKDATVQSTTRRAHRIAKYQHRIHRIHKEREGDECVCAHLERHVFFSLNRFCGFYEEKDTSFWEEKVCSEKEARLRQN